jgi:hypothetical protein
MRRVLPLLLFAMLFAPRARAGEVPADAATALAPQGTIAVVRLPPLDRIDALAAEFKPIVLKFVGASEREALAAATLSRAFLAEVGLEDAPEIARDRAIYVAIGEDDAFVLLLPAKAGAEFAERPVGESEVARLRNDFVCVGPKALLDAPTRASAVQMLRGDVAVHVFLAELVERHAEDVAGALGQLDAGAVPGAPAFFGPAMKRVAAVARDVMEGVDAFGYALTWTGERLEAEGRLATREGSRLRSFFGRAGAAEGSDLAGFLPRNALLTIDSSGKPNWLSSEVASAVADVLGAGAADAFEFLMGAILPAELLTGRTATSVTMEGMMSSVVAVSELKDGAKAAEALQRMNLEATNAALKKLGLPVSLAFEPAVAEHAGTKIHRMRIQLDDPGMMMMAAMLPQSYLAVEGNYLLLSQSQMGDGELRALIDLVRAGNQAGDHPHVLAMNRLLRKRNFGLTINVGALKPLAFFLAMQAPQAAAAVNALPDRLLLSTAATFEGGELRWRGDWPVKEIAAVAEAVAGSQASGPGEEEVEEEMGEDEEEIR